jgi:hypothetical protein
MFTFMLVAFVLLTFVELKPASWVACLAIFAIKLGVPCTRSYNFFESAALNITSPFCFVP